MSDSLTNWLRDTPTICTSTQRTHPTDMIIIRIETPGWIPRFFNQTIAGDVMMAIKQASKNGMIILLAARNPAIKMTNAAILNRPRDKPDEFMAKVKQKRGRSARRIR
jgi:hypothetical protein